MNKEAKADAIALAFAQSLFSFELNKDFSEFDERVERFVEIYEGAKDVIIGKKLLNDN